MNGVHIRPVLDYTLSPVEIKVSNKEKELRLENVKFSEFEQAIKRFGYTGRLQE